MQASTIASSSRNPGASYSSELRGQLVTAAGTNAFDVFCPLGGCRCILLRKGASTLVKRNSEPLSHPRAKPTKHANEQFPLENKEGDSQEIECWLVTSPMAFENVGFTKGVLSNGKDEAEKPISSLPEGANIRYLACADCDCGPLGWHIEAKGRDLGADVAAEREGRAQIRQEQQPDTREFLVDVTRCRYKLEA